MLKGELNNKGGWNNEADRRDKSMLDAIRDGGVRRKNSARSSVKKKMDGQLSLGDIVE